LALGCAVVLDVGKTSAKLTLWSPEGRLLDRRSRANQTRSGQGYAALDVEGIADWLADTLRSLARQGDIAAIIPVAHGAAACVLDGKGGCVPPVDYEAEPPAAIRDTYIKLRDPFAVTGSPCLPAGLNLGAQLYWLDAIMPEEKGQILTWPQYWAWLLSGVAATEITSLGTHTDLWCPATASPSPLAKARGWAQRLAPLRPASEILGPVTEDWRRRCDLPANCAVLCGIHDSNAALLAARLYPEVRGSEFTVLSTGTWFVAMRSLPPGAAADTTELAEARDCLVNVDAAGAPVPSSRFMGGREAELIEAPSGEPIELAVHNDALLARTAKLVEQGVLALPSFQPGVGPFPHATGRWSRRPDDQLDRRAAASLYLALMADASLDLIGSSERLIVEGRFAEDIVFTRTLAALRPQQTVYVSAMADNIPLGALHLFNPGIRPDTALRRVEALAIELNGYARQWREATHNEPAMRSARAANKRGKA